MGGLVMDAVPEGSPWPSVEIGADSRHKPTRVQAYRNTVVRWWATAPARAASV
jgi:hypothetical protein